MVINWISIIIVFVAFIFAYILTPKEKGQEMRTFLGICASLIVGVSSSLTAGVFQNPSIKIELPKIALVEADAKVKADADAQEKVEADAQAKAVADAQEKVEADAQAKAVADAQAKAVADAQARAEADAKANAVNVIPTLSQVVYDGRTFTAHIPMTIPDEYERYSIIFYLQRSYRTPTTESFVRDLNPNTPSFSITLSENGNPPIVGEYIFWAVFQNRNGSGVGQPSNSVRLILTD